ncbi:MAG: aminopeptidase P family protein, partial [Sphaerochaetaceae bacterium]|nr:aminopeptidase P family protein [Sphaerochaetaceae bacterium]
KNLNIIAEDDILNTIWSDRPSMPDYPIVSLDKEITGATIEEKVNKIRMLGQKNKEDVFLLTALDDIAWTLNLRGQDIENTPVFMAYLVISKDSVDLFTPKARFTNVIPQGYNVHEYDEISSFLENLNNVKVRLDPETTNMLLFNSINKGNNVTISEGRSYATDLKACKNEVELDGIRVAHVLDGVAMVNFLAMVKRKDYDFTELSIAQALEDERSCEEEYLGPSFSTIAGFGSHGAIVHYSATEETDVSLTGNGLLVLDSGGQYTGGTTDITRTILFGEATQEQKDDYTMVLKGHLALCSQVFPEGTTGHQLDVLAHQFLWQKGMDYYHGTGHGVGHRLSVHEGPMRISSKAGKEQIPLKEGMVISDEPGLYKENSHGIRIENLIAVTKAMETEFGKFLTFEVLTCCPYERELINKDLLTEEEISMVDSYHSWVYETLKDMVEETSLSYLEEATKAL